MKGIHKIFFLGVMALNACHFQPRQAQDGDSDVLTIQQWQKKPFFKVDSINPILTPSSCPIFRCPVRGEMVHWEEKDVFNPAAVFKEQKIFLLYRAEDVIGKYAGTSRLGLAVSEDGIHFTKFKKPVFYPDLDKMKDYEWEGGCEDPRIVENDEGKYFLTYTAWDGKTDRKSVV